MRNIRRLLKNRKGIDTILAALLMVVIVVVASVMVYAWSTGLLGALLVTPNVGKEALNIENSGFVTLGSSANQNVTLYLRNTGSASISLVTYYVRNSSGAQYSRTNWGGPSQDLGPNHPIAIAPNALGAEIVIISTACGTYCTGSPTGTTFNFSPGTAYTVVVVTSRNNQFTFSVTR